MCTHQPTYVDFFITLVRCGFPAAIRYHFMSHTSEYNTVSCGTLTHTVVGVGMRVMHYGSVLWEAEPN